MHLPLAIALEPDNRTLAANGQTKTPAQGWGRLLRGRFDSMSRKKLGMRRQNCEIRKPQGWVWGEFLLAARARSTVENPEANRTRSNNQRSHYT